MNAVQHLIDNGYRKKMAYKGSIKPTECIDRFIGYKALEINKIPFDASPECIPEK
jgi:DNA-binding LacI/PurR family transcriptional regulator